MNYTDMNDKDFEGYLMQKGLGGDGLDFDAMEEDEKARLMKYMQSSESKQMAPAKGEAMAMQLGLSQMQGKDMSQPQRMGLPGLMGMATQGIQRVPNGTRRGLMGEI